MAENDKIKIPDALKGANTDVYWYGLEDGRFTRRRYIREGVSLMGGTVALADPSTGAQSQIPYRWIGQIRGLECYTTDSDAAGMYRHMLEAARKEFNDLSTRAGIAQKIFETLEQAGPPEEPAHDEAQEPVEPVEEGRIVRIALPGKNGTANAMKKGSAPCGEGLVKILVLISAKNAWSSTVEDPEVIEKWLARFLPGPLKNFRTTCWEQYGTEQVLYELIAEDQGLKGGRP